MVLCCVLHVHMAIVLTVADLKRGCLAVEKIVVSQKSRGHHRNAEGSNAYHDVLHNKELFCLNVSTWLSMSCTGAPFTKSWCPFH